MTQEQQEERPMTIEERITQLETLVRNTMLGQNITQAVVKKMLNDIARLDKDAENAIDLVNTMQYRTLALVNVSGLNKDALNAEADSLKLADFQSFSDKDDADKKLVEADVVEENSTVIITSTVNGQDGSGIFRTKVSVKALGDSELAKALIGKRVNDKFDAAIENEQHNITIVGIRKPLPEVGTET